jgi:hypothetical protein
MPMVHGGSEAISACSLAWGHVRAHQRRVAVLIDAVEGEDVLGEIDADEDNGHGLPLLNELMEKTHFPSWHSSPFAASRQLGTRKSSSLVGPHD